MQKYLLLARQKKGRREKMKVVRVMAVMAPRVDTAGG